MTDYTTHADGLFDPGKPILGATGLEARDNLISVAEGGSGAPKIANKITGGEQDTIFSGLADFGGVLIWGSFRGTGGGASTNKIDVSASTDGSTYGALSAMVEVDNLEMTPFQLFIDFSTGAWQSAYDLRIGGAGDGTYTTGTLANTVGITHLRLVLNGVGSQAAYLVMPQGGQSAT